MSLFDHFPEQPAKDWSLAEEAATFAPPLWEPAHVAPEGLTPLPGDFPVQDPFGPGDSRLDTLRAAMAEHAVCRTKECPLDDREILARGVAAGSVEYIGEMQGIAAILYAHGETLAADLVVENLNTLAEHILRPFFESAGLEVDDDL